MAAEKHFLLRRDADKDYAGHAGQAWRENRAAHSLKLFALLGPLLLWGLPAAGQTPGPARVTLDQAIQMAVEHNHALKAARTLVPQSQAQEVTANLRPNPVLSWDSQFVPIFSPHNFSADALNERGRAVRGAMVLVLGVTYKPDVNDIRESPALEIIQALARKGAQVSYADPFVPQLALDDLKLAVVEPSAETVAAADCVLILTNHSTFDYAMVADRATLVVDTRNAMKDYRRSRSWIVRL